MDAKKALNLAKILLGGKGRILTIVGLLFSSSSLVIAIIFLGFFAILGFTIYELCRGLPGQTPGIAGAYYGGDLSYPTGTDPTSIGQCLDNWLKKNQSNSPLIGYGLHFAQAGQQYNVNPALLLAIAGAESSFATNWSAIPSSTHNYASLTCGCTQNSPCVKKQNTTNPRTWESYGSWPEAISKHALYMNKKYLSQGINDIDSIARIYVGYASDWPQTVKKYMNSILSTCPQLKTFSFENITSETFRKDYYISSPSELANLSKGRMREIRGIVLHYTAGSNVQGAVATFKARNTYTHLIIDKKGQVFQILPLDTWVRSGSSKGNSFAIGIEIVGMNEAELLQNETQFKSVIATVKWLINKFNIPNVKGTTLYNQEDVAKARGIFGHYHTDPGRKSDPGKKYMEKVWNTLGSQ